MKHVTISLISMVFLFLLGVLVYGADPQAVRENSSIQSFKVSPSYFIPNNPHAKTGKRIVDDNEVVAFVQTRQGRVMFTPSGAFIGMAVPWEGLEKRPAHIENDKFLNDLENFENQPMQMVVMMCLLQS